jgi:hypothetical protein
VQATRFPKFPENDDKVLNRSGVDRMTWKATDIEIEQPQPRDYVMTRKTCPYLASS